VQMSNETIFIYLLCYIDNSVMLEKYCGFEFGQRRAFVLYIFTNRLQKEVFNQKYYF
jgi:hypothetical protein